MVRWAALVLAVFLAAQLAGCAGKDDLLLHLGFEKGSGNLLQDTGGGAGQAELKYVLTNTPYNTPQDPQWREQGVEGGCLLFDGSSNYAAFSPDAIAVEGKTFSISVWVAPRTFEWDDPNGAANGTEHLTAIV